MGSDDVIYETDAQWLSEPGYLKMMFQRKDDILHIHLDTADNFEDKAIMKEERCFSVSFRTFKDAVIRELLRILSKYGIRGYYESWSDHRDFPLGMLLTILGCSSDEKEVGMYISDLSKEYKLLNECNL